MGLKTNEHNLGEHHLVKKDQRMEMVFVDLVPGKLGTEPSSLPESTVGMSSKLTSDQTCMSWI